MATKICNIGGLIVVVSLLGHLGGGMGVGLVSLLRPNLLYEDSLFSPWDVWYFLGSLFTAIIGSWGLNTIFKINTGGREEIIPFLICCPSYFSTKMCELSQTIIFAFLISIANVTTYHYLRVP